MTSSDKVYQISIERQLAEFATGFVNLPFDLKWHDGFICLLTSIGTVQNFVGRVSLISFNMHLPTNR